MMNQKPLEALLKKHMSDVNPWLQRLILWSLPDLMWELKSGKKIPIIDP